MKLSTIALLLSFSLSAFATITQTKTVITDGLCNGPRFLCGCASTKNLQFQMNSYAQFDCDGEGKILKKKILSKEWTSGSTFVCEYKVDYKCI